jgi:hypothetical protein
MLVLEARMPVAAVLLLLCCLNCTSRRKPVLQGRTAGVHGAAARACAAAAAAAAAAAVELMLSLPVLLGFQIDSQHCRSQSCNVCFDRPLQLKLHGDDNISDTTVLGAADCTAMMSSDEQQQQYDHKRVLISGERALIVATR